MGTDLNFALCVICLNLFIRHFVENGIHNEPNENDGTEHTEAKPGDWTTHQQKRTFLHTIT